MHSLHPPCAFFLPISPLPAFSPWLPYVLQHTSFFARAYNIYKEYGHSSFPSPPLLFLDLNCLYIMRFCIIHWFFRQKNSLIACRSGIKPYLCTRFRKGTPLNARRSGSLLEKSPAKIWRFEKSALSLQTVSLFCGSRWKQKRSMKCFGWDEGKEAVLLPPVHLDGSRRQIGWVLTEDNYKKKDILQWRVWSWLRMNASYRLNTCKSRGSGSLAC